MPTRARASLNEFIRENGCTYENDKGWQQPRPELMVATQKSKLMMSPRRIPVFFGV